MIRLLARAARSAEATGDDELLETAFEALFTWDGRWDQWNPQREIQTWLEGLKGDAARVVGAVLSRRPESATHFSELSRKRAADPSIRAAVRPP